jgi:hypothetical protein
MKLLNLLLQVLRYFLTNGLKMIYGRAIGVKIFFAAPPNEVFCMMHAGKQRCALHCLFCHLSPQALSV